MSNKRNITNLNQARLKMQVHAVCEKTYALLGDPIDQLEGNIETERVVLNIPKAFTYLSTYLAFLARNNGNHVPAWEHHEETFKRKYKNERAIMRGFFEHLIENAMHEEFHLLCQIKHTSINQLETTK